MNHQSISRHIHKRSSIYLTLLYLAAVLARFLIALSWSDNPWIMPDEAWYTNLARSLFTTGQVLFRTQPIKYDALLYPLLLSHLYGLGGAVDTFRTIQLLNAFLINAWVFPMWYLARSVTGSHKSAWVVAIICLLLPD
ncbi:MAG: hypothetical protein GX781_03815, partial [Clostridiales bacterium]|nr:hypothetical protein [Clostridiales bacterium]